LGKLAEFFQSGSMALECLFRAARRAEDFLRRHGGSFSAQEANVRPHALKGSDSMTPDLINTTLGIAFFATWFFIGEVLLAGPGANSS
jgi:hypothetical protein